MRCCVAETMKFPTLPLASLDTLWFQVAGTLCNLRCNHCFISCSPENHTLEMMSLERFQTYLDDAAAVGVKEFYFTGGEPFIHKDIFTMIGRVLEKGPLTVLTNATRIDAAKAERLAELREGSIYSLELRVSLDGFSPETNDPIRGPGTFDAAMKGFEHLVRADFLPIVTAMRSWAIEEDEERLMAFRERLAQAGCNRPRLKLLPSLKIGAEALRDAGYSEADFLTTEMLRGYDVSQLLCHNSRIASEQGLHVCPILVDQPDALMGETLADGMKPYALRHQACSTCYQFGALCSNASGQQVETARLERTVAA